MDFGTGASTNIKITISGPDVGSFQISLDDLVVYEGGFASAAYGSQSSSLSEFLFLEKTKFDYQPNENTQEFTVPIILRAGLDQNRFARLLISFQPQDENIPPSLLPISVVAVLNEKSLPENILIEPASNISKIEIKESNTPYKIKKYIPAIPKLIDSEYIKIKTITDYQKENLAWAQVFFDYKDSLNAINTTELPGVLLLSGQSQEIIYDSFQEKAINFSNLPKVGLITFDAYLLDPTTGQIIVESKTSSWAIAFPWKIPFLILVGFIISLALWYKFMRADKSINNQSLLLKVSKQKLKKSEIELAKSFQTPLQYLIYSVAAKSSDEKSAVAAAINISEKYKSTRSLARASKKSLQLFFEPTGLSEQKAFLTHEMARYLVDNFEGEVPLDLESLQQLPGQISPKNLLILAKSWGK